MPLYYNVYTNTDNNFYVYGHAVEFAESNGLEESDIEILQRPWEDPRYQEFFFEALPIIREIANYNDYTRLVYSELFSGMMIILPAPGTWIGQDFFQNGFTKIASERQSNGNAITIQQIKTLRELLWKYYIPFDINPGTGEMSYRNVE